MRFKHRAKTLADLIGVVLLGIGFLIHPLSSHAVDDILVMGLFRDKALLLVRAYPG